MVRTRQTHPFYAARKMRPTLKHTPAIWECLLGTVYARNAQGEVDSLKARIAVAEQQINVAQAQVNARETDLTDMEVRAPFDGIAISKDAQPGEMVSPVSAGGGFTRTGISTIVDMRSLEIEVDVNESYINRVTPDQDVTAILNAYPDWQIPARVITLVPAADRQKATVLVRIAFKQLDSRILPDMGVKVTFLRAPSGGAPADAAQSSAQSNSRWASEPSRFATHKSSRPSSPVITKVSCCPSGDQSGFVGTLPEASLEAEAR